MKISNAHWATIGKALTGAGTAVALVLGLLQLWSTAHGPSVVAVIERQSTSLPPEIREQLKNSYTRAELLNTIEESEKKKEAPTEVLSDLKAEIAKPKTDLDVSFMSFGSSGAWYVMVINESGEVARDVKLILPGTGKADFTPSPYSTLGPDKPPVNWKNELALGTIPAHGQVDVVIWADGVPYLTLTDENTAVLHRDGEGKVRQWQQFYGWDADLVQEFLALPALVRYGALLVLLAGAAVGMMQWRRRRRANSAAT